MIYLHVIYIILYNCEKTKITAKKDILNNLLNESEINMATVDSCSSYNGFDIEQ